MAKFNADKAVWERCIQCTRLTWDSLGLPDCPHHLLPVVGMDCFFRKMPNLCPPPAAQVSGGEAREQEEKRAAFRVKIRRVNAPAGCGDDLPAPANRADSEHYVAEVCPHCERENTFVWDVEREGFTAYCPGCGERLMLCSECAFSGENCDYNDYSDFCHMM